MLKSLINNPAVRALAIAALAAAIGAVAGQAEFVRELLGQVCK
jgi:hypothetical protein